MPIFPRKRKKKTKEKQKEETEIQKREKGEKREHKKLSKNEEGSFLLEGCREKIEIKMLRCNVTCFDPIKKKLTYPSSWNSLSFAKSSPLSLTLYVGTKTTVPSCRHSCAMRKEVSHLTSVAISSAVSKAFHCSHSHSLTQLILAYL